MVVDSEKVSAGWKKKNNKEVHQEDCTKPGIHYSG